jgi:hypothetical protein
MFLKLFFGIFTYNLKADAKDDLKFNKDDGLARRLYGVRAMHYLSPCKNRQEAEALEEQWKKEDLAEELQKHTSQAEKDAVVATWNEEWPKRPRDRFTMYDEKRDRIMQLAPQRMAKMIQIHQADEKLPVPPQVEAWTAEMWANAAPVNPLEKKVGEWYCRCPCKLKAGLGIQSNNLNLVGADGKACPHNIKGSTLVENLKGCPLDNGSTLFQLLVGESKKHDPIYAMLAKVRMEGVSLCKKILGKQPVIPGLVPKGTCSVAAAAGPAPTSPTAGSASAP